MKHTSPLGVWRPFTHLLLAIGLLLNFAAFDSLQAQYSISNIWKISTGDNRPYVTTNATERAVAYNPTNNHVYLVSRAGSLRVAILDGDTGSEIGFLATAGISGGTFNLSMIAVAEDGAIYGANLVTSGNGFKVYRWSDEAALPIAVFNGSPSGTFTGRWGDNLDLRGSGTNTEILVASGDLTLAAILKPTDDTMTQFAGVGINVSSIAAGDMQKGVAFGLSNTFYAKRTGLGTLRQIRYDLGTGLGTVIANHSIAAGVAGISFDTNTLLIAGVQTANATTGHQLNVYDASINGNLPTVGTVAFPTPGFPNPNVVGGVDVAGNRIYAVDTQNGVVAAQIVTSSTTVAPAIASQPASQTAVQGGYTSFSGAATGSRPIDYRWELNGNPISGATNTVLLLTNIAPGQAGNYRLVAVNAAGSATSSVAVLTVTPAVLSSALTPLWKKSPGELPFLNDTDGAHRSIAYNPLSGHLLVVSRTGSNAVHIIDPSNGGYLGTLNNGSGIINGGLNGILLNMVSVTSDGFIYAGNVSSNGMTQEFRLYRWTDEDPLTTPTVAWRGDPGTNETAGTSVPNRWGDTMAARFDAFGQPQILLGSRSGTAISVITPVAGSETWPPYAFDVAGAGAGNFGLGIAWGAGDTFWGKATSQTLRHVSLDFNSLAGQILHTFNDFPNIGPIGVDSGANLLAGLAVETPDNVRLLDISNPDAGLGYLDTDFFSTDNANANGTGALVFVGDQLYALDSNNGLMAFRMAPRLHYSVSGNRITFSWSGSYVLQSRNSLTGGSWGDVSSTSGHSVTIGGPGAKAFYRLRE
jgi:hypothetical protein